MMTNTTTTETKTMTQVPDLTSFDWIVLNTSGGKDSLAMLAVVADELKRLGLMDRAVVVHADLGRVEWEGTRDLAERQARALGFERFEIVARDQDLLDQIEQRGKFPSSAARYCTSDQKTSQVHKLFTRLSKETKQAKGRDYHVSVLSCLGFTPDESPARAKKCANVVEVEKKPTNKTKSVLKWYPLHDWTVPDVWNLIRARGLEYHPAYDLGMTRLSCVFCVFASKADLLVAGRANPDLLAQYVAVEERIGHRFQNSRAIREIQDEIQANPLALAS